MSRLAKVVVLSVSFLVFSYVALGYVLGKSNDDKDYRSLGVFSEVLAHIQQDYVDDPNMAVVTVGALHGLLEALDPLSSYLSPREYADYRMKTQNPAKGETGLSLSKRFGYVAVVAVLPDSPAMKAGVRDGDILEAIAGFTTREMSVGQAQILLNGDPGTSVKVGVVRRGSTAPQEIDIVRAAFAPPKAVVEKLEADTAYLGVASLESGKAAELRDKLTQLDRQGMKKLVLDLRECARGDATEAFNVARLFVGSGTLGSVKGQTVTRQEFAADPSKVVWKHPMTVLISNSTSGAAEILAAAIGGNKRGELVGERSFGTASEQKLIPLEDGAAIILTVANYYTPAGKSIPDDGVTPTVEVRGAIPDVDTDDSGASSAAPARPPLAEDPVVRKALDILKGETRKAAENRLTRRSRFVPIPVEA